jgi:hypothetical protein
MDCALSGMNGVLFDVDRSYEITNYGTFLM